MDTTLVLSLDHRYLASGSHSPGAMLANRCHWDQDRQGPRPHKAFAAVTLERLSGMLNLVIKKHYHGSGFESFASEPVSEWLQALGQALGQ